MIAAATNTTDTVYAAGKAYLRASVVPRPATMRQFAEDHVVLTRGPHRGPFRCSRQPFTGLLLDEIDSGRWTTCAITGPSQSGKTLAALVIPTLHSAIELGETVVLGIPEGDMVADKWEIDFEPIMSESPTLRGYLPTRGSGSKGGKAKDSVTLSNGCVLKFMTAGGSDSGKAGFTTRFVNVTEAARWSGQSELSQESNRLNQLWARTRGYARSQKRMIVEGTVTIATELPWCLRGSDVDDDRISSASRLVTPCPHCGEWIAPEREHFIGWQDAKHEDAAANDTFFYCPACGQRLTEEERHASNRDVRLIHAGQHVDNKGDIVGEPPRTSTLWFRWSQWNNLLIPSSDIAVDEWLAQRIDPESDAGISAERELCQFVWCVPYDPPEREIIPLTPEDVIGRSDQHTMGVLPVAAIGVGVGVDIRASQIHFSAVAFSETTRWLLEFGVINVNRSLGVRRGALAALETLRDRLSAGYTDAIGRTLKPSAVLIDAGWKSEVARKFVRDSKLLGWRNWFPAFGRGQSSNIGGYHHPTAITRQKVGIGDQYYFALHPKHKLVACIVNSDEWKSNLHEALSTAADKPGAMMVFAPQTDDEKRRLQMLARHVTNEKACEKVRKDKGVVTVWTNSSHRVNHGLDCTYNALVACHIGGNRVITEATHAVARIGERRARRKRHAFSRDGRPYMAFQR